MSLEQVQRRELAVPAGYTDRSGGAVFRLLFRRDALADLRDDLVVHAAVHQLLPDADRVLDRAPVAAAVADQTVTTDAQQRRAAVLLPVVLVVDLLHHRRELLEQFRGV